MPPVIPKPKTNYAPATQEQTQNWQTRAGNQAALQFDPQLLANQQQGGTARQGAKQQRFQINQSTAKALQSLALANKQRRQALPGEHNLRGLYNSGIMAEAVGDQNDAYQRGVTDINVGGMGQLANVGQNLQLALSQLGAQRGMLQGNRGKFISGAIEDLRTTWEDKSFRDLQYGNQLGQQTYDNQWGQFQQQQDMAMAMRSLAARGGGGGGAPKLGPEWANLAGIGDPDNIDAARYQGGLDWASNNWSQVDGSGKGGGNRINRFMNTLLSTWGPEPAYEFAAAQYPAYKDKYLRQGKSNKWINSRFEKHFEVDPSGF